MRALELERLASPPASQALELERLGADESMRAERAATDALLERERGRVDTRAAVNRQERDEDRAEQESQRQDTNARLSDERSGADRTLAALNLTTSALADSQTEQARRPDVLAMVTHDLRSPLTVIVANANFITKDTAEAATREAADDMLGAATRMGRLLTDLLDVARIESGTLRVVKGVHDVRALLTEVLHSYRPLFASRGVRFSIDLPVAPLLARFDHDRVVQILSNLLGNAMKFTPRGGVVELHAECCAGKMALVLRDSGPGIEPSALPHVFERFWKSDGDAQTGLGLGLYICKCIAEAHGGSISVESDLGKGASFRVSFPASEGADDAA